jgi:hypothetical protein
MNTHTDEPVLASVHDRRLIQVHCGRYITYHALDTNGLLARIATVFLYTKLVSGQDRGLHALPMARNSATASLFAAKATVSQ